MMWLRKDYLKFRKGLWKRKMEMVEEGRSGRIDECRRRSYTFKLVKRALACLLDLGREFKIRKGDVSMRCRSINGSDVDVA